MRDGWMIVVKTDLDGVHWDAVQHRSFGKDLADMVQKIL